MTLDSAAPSTRTIAVCGSTGKATTCYIMDFIATALGRSTAIYSTVESTIGAQRAPVGRDHQPKLTQVRDQANEEQIDDVILELTWDDYTMDDAAALKLDLVALTHVDSAYEADGVADRRSQAEAALAAAGQAIILVDSDEAYELSQRLPTAVTVGTTLKGPDADWQVNVNHSTDDHMDFSLTHRDGRSLSMSLWLPARFSVGLAALALVTLLESGVSTATLVQALPHGLRPVVPGRMERVADHPRCIVDIAHTPARLERALKPLRRSTKGELIVVIAARATDSPQDRRRLGEAASIADTVVVTDDDYGSGDDPSQIRADVLAGAATGNPKLSEVSPRRAAIRSAVALASRHDTVLIAGRGHLTSLLVAGEQEHLDDRAEVRAGLAGRTGSSAQTP